MVFLWLAAVNLGEGPPLNPQQTLVDDPQHVTKDMDNGNTNPKEKSEIVTLEPYSIPKTEKTQVKDKDNKSEDVTNSKPRRRKYKTDPTLIHFDSLFGNDSWSRYLIFNTETELTAAKFENILLSKCPTREMTFRSMNHKEWLVETTTRAQSETYQALDNVNGVKVKVQRHDKLNSIEGTVILPRNNDCDGLPDETLLLNSLKLRYPNVEHIKVYEIPSKKQPGGKLRIGRIKFEGHVLPSNIKIEGQKRELLPYVPKPLQCKNCSKYGHTHTKCRNPSKCAFCGTEKHKTTWNCGTPKCLNCGQDHHARSKTCPFYIYNTELKLLISRTGMSIQEAKLELKSKGFMDPARNPTYRDAVRTKTPIDSENLEVKTNQNRSQEVVDNNIELDKDKLTTVPVRNRYEILEQDEDETTTVEVHMEEDIDMNRNKRTRDQNSPPKVNENTTATKRKVLKLNRQTSSDKDLLDDVSPSPIFKSRFSNIMKTSKDLQENKVCECQLCIQEGVTSQAAIHHDRCGCNNCFLKDCKETIPLTRDKLRNVIRNFLSRKDSSGTSNPIESHPENCMCIKHLHYYRTNKISMLDNFLTKQDDNSQNETNSDIDILKN